MAKLLLIQGPAGGGKSQLYSQLLATGEITIIADYTRLFVAATGVERDPITGLYPVRSAQDAAVRDGTASYLQVALVRHSLRNDRDTAVTTSRAAQEARWQAVADEFDAEFEVRTVDPGREVVTERLRAQSGTGELLEECATAISRWYR